MGGGHYPMTAVCVRDEGIPPLPKKLDIKREKKNAMKEDKEPITCAPRKRGEEHKLETGGNIAGSITTIATDSMVTEPSEPEYRIRKLTPRECFRLMDVSDEDIDKIQAAGISKSQQYKLAGNSIVCSVLYHIFKAMFIEQVQPTEPRQLELF
jgi:site-specific DNA-cytosine methylase